MAVNWNIRKYTKEEFTEAWLAARSVAHCAKMLGLTIYGSTYQSLRSAADELGLDESHMLGQGWNFRDSSGILATARKTRPLSDILVANSDYTSSNNLKLRLFKEGIKASQCEWCLIEEWNGVPAPLELDHINGNRKDNRIENLRILCPNCHAQTETYRGKNIGRAGVAQLADAADLRSASGLNSYAGSTPVTRTKTVCIDCNKEISFRSARCKPCAGVFREPTKIEWPPVEDLIEMTDRLGYSATGRMLGVSDNAVRKRIKSCQ